MREHRKYLENKFSWEADGSGLVRWKVTPTSKMSVGRRRFVVSMSHSWLPLNETLHWRGQIESPTCSICGRDSESMEHFTYCSHYKTAKNGALRQALDGLSVRMGVDPGIAAILWKGLDEATYRANLMDPGTVPAQYKPLVAQQNRIGWSHLWSGRWVHRWATTALPVQGTETGVANRDTWIKRSIATIWSHMHERWKERGQLKEEDRHKIEKTSLLRRAERIMGKVNNLPASLKFLAKPGIQKLKNQPTQNIKYWLSKSGDLIWRLTKKGGSKNTGPMHKFLRIRKRNKEGPRLKRNERRSTTNRRWEIRKRTRQKEHN